MHVIAPLGSNATTITEAMLTASSVPETPPAAYNPATTYALNAEVSVAGSHNSFDVYRSLQGGNTGHTPSSSPTWWRKLGTTYGVYAGGTTYAKDDRVIDPVLHLEYLSLVGSNTGHTPGATGSETFWQLQGPTNRWRMFDLNSSTGTTAPSPIEITLTPGQRIDALGLAGLIAAGFQVEMKQGATVVYSHEESLSTRVVRSWRDWLTKPFTFRTESGLFDLPLISSGVVTITFTRASGDVTVGALFANRHIFMGDIETEPNDDAQNYSTFQRNIEGSASTFVPKRVIPILTAQCFAAAELVPDIRRLRDDLRATPAFWSGLKDPTNPYFGSVQRVGVWRRFSITPGHPDARVDVDVEEA